jgi:hypothetical protein
VFKVGARPKFKLLANTELMPCEKNAIAGQKSSRRSDNPQAILMLC